MFAIYLIIGALTGTLSGLLGVGGGIIVVPALAGIFNNSTVIPPSYAMQVAVATSLAIMVFTAASGLFAHHRYCTVRWDLLKFIIPFLLLGTFCGVILANFIPSKYLRMLFGIFLFLIGLRMLFQKKQAVTDNRLPKTMMKVLAVFIGGLATLLGAGGGVMLVPFWLHSGLDIRHATGTSLAGASLIALVASISFIFSSLFIPVHFPMTTGFVYWPAFLGIAAASMLFAPFGTMLAHKLSTTLLKRIFAVFLFIISIDMLW